jgi:hypothetical protein
MNPDALSINDKPMSYRDAAIVATVLTLVMAASVFMPTHGYDVFLNEPPRFVWDLTVFLFSSWISEFVILTGLTAYAKSKSSGDRERTG